MTIVMTKKDAFEPFFSSFWAQVDISAH